ncbi:hypothetical protein L9F63_012361, partial [Diploptera punctata]
VQGVTDKLTIFKDTLVQSIKKTKQMLMYVQVNTLSVQKMTSRVVKERQRLQTVAESTRQQQKNCRKDLVDILPLLKSTHKALDTLRAADITVLRTMKFPPETIKLVMEAVCVLRDVTPLKVRDRMTGEV